MTPFSLAIASIRARPLQSSLCVAATAAGIALVCVVFLLSGAVERGFLRNAQGIDIVVGAKGSPLQLVLSSVYHADIPTGNISTADAEKLEHHAQVKQVIPLALGDNFRGYRIVGTTPEYIGLYGGEIKNGSIFNKPFEAVAGTATGMKVGERFAGAHGLSAGGEVHEDSHYQIVGTLEPTGSVLDRLILTSVASVQELHEHHEGHEDGKEEHEHEHEAYEAGEEPHNQVTALLVKVKGPMAVVNLPREISRIANLQAASPAYEMARMWQAMGFGRDLLAALGMGFVALSALMLMSGLASGLSARRYDLAVLRVLGAAPKALFATIIAEGLALSVGGTLIGMLIGHIAAYCVAAGIESLRGVVLPSQFLMLSPVDATLLTIGVGVGLAAAAIPGLLAARTDIAALLARGRA